MVLTVPNEDALLDELDAICVADVPYVAVTEPDIGARVAGNRTLIGQAVRDLVATGTLSRTGAGKRGDPFLYGRSDGRLEV